MQEIDIKNIIQLSKSCLNDKEKQSVLGVLDREYLGMGNEVRLFEEALTEYFGRPVTCVINGTAALHLALQASGIGDGDEVLVPSLTYVASYQAISATGAKPVACDIDINTCILDWKDAERRVSSRTKALMPVHYGGGVGDLNSIYNFAERYNLRVVEDAAHAFGSIYNGKRVGGFGDIACFSFDGIKNITSGEGGCIVTEDEAVIQRIQDARLLGVEKDTGNRYVGKRSWEFDVNAQGWRYHMSNLMAAIGIEQLKKISEMGTKRQRIACLYDSLLSDTEHIELIARDYSLIIPHIYVIRIKKKTNRNLLQDRLLNKGIQTGVHYYPNHKLSFYRDDSVLPFPATDIIFPELLTLPLHYDLSEQDVEYICEQLITELNEKN